jgi:beta-galactosidase
MTVRHRGLRRWAGATLALAATMVAAAQDVRVSVPLNAGWRFMQSQDLENVEAPGFDDASWGCVDVPHTWNRIGNEGTERSPLSNDVQGIGWYRLHFKAPPAPAGSRYFLQFDAVSTVADVWLNGRYLGKHTGAFARFRFDASASIHAAADNVLVVKADNSRPRPGSSTQDVIPLAGDFFMFGGIYRGVSLIVTNPVHVDMLDFGGPGVYARLLNVDPRAGLLGAANLQVSGRIADELKRPQRVAVAFTLQDRTGATVASRLLKTTAIPGISEVQTQLHLDAPHLWRGTRDPYLYRLSVIIRSQSGAILDSMNQTLGLRSVKFDPERGLFLNGEHVFLKGASMHQDRPIKGWAISQADQRQDFDMLQDLGANAVRLAHYQHDEYAYQLADERGILAWAEIPLVNKVSFDGSPANAAFTANAQQQLTELVRQNFNHPAIVVWSVGNEIDLTATQTKGLSQAAALVKSLNELAKREDPSRATTLADCCEIGIAPQAGATLDGIKPREPLVGITDTVGYNRYFGWYVGRVSDLGGMLDDAHVRHPGLPMSVSEYGAGAALTQHSDDATGGIINPHGRPHPEEYQSWYHERSWAILAPRQYLWGVFIWNLFDFASDYRKEGDLTDVNEKGLVSYDRHTQKDAYYFYRANWNSQLTVHLTGRRYVDRAYAVTDVKAYSNAAQALLTLNGREIGPSQCTHGICVWPAVHLSQGGNELAVTAQIDGVTMSDSVHWFLSHSDRIVNIKAGDLSGYVAKDGQRYGSDMYFAQGTGQRVDAADGAVPKPASITAEDSGLYDTYREGDFAYRVPLPNGRYRVRLEFEEPTASAAGMRIFDVEANGATRLKDFDVFKAAGGKLRGVEREFEVRIEDGTLRLAFRPQRGSAVVSALSITPLA